MKRMVALSNFADGAVDERFNMELRKVLENMQDRNTDAKAVRKITLTVTIKGNETRNIADVSVQAKTALAPALGTEAVLLLDFEKDGTPTAAELKSGIPGQTYLDNDGDIANDKGEKIEEFEESSKVVKFQ